MNIFGVDENLSEIDGANAAIDEFKKFLFETLGLKNKLSDLNIDDKNFEIMAKKSCGQGELNGFITLTPKDVEEIFRASL